MQFDILSLFPEYFESPFQVSMLKRAKEKGLVRISLKNIRDFSKDKHQKVDDKPYGGGPGMLLSAEPILDAIASVKTEESYVVYLTPQGKLLTPETCKRLATKKHVILLCGHYEGIDERVIESEVDEEISIGDYVLTSGCPAAVVLVDSVVRFIPGVLGNPEGAKSDSFEKDGILEGPQYTRPYSFRGNTVPEVLLSGNHAEIEKYKKEKGLQKVKENRPDLFAKKS